MSDHHQHGVLIARPPKRETGKPASDQGEHSTSQSCGACTHGAAPFSGHSTFFGRFLTRLFAEKQERPHPPQ